MRVILQTTGKQIAHKVNYFLVESPHMTLLDWSVILIDDDDRCSSMMCMEHSGKV